MGERSAKPFQAASRLPAGPGSAPGARRCQASRNCASLSVRPASAVAVAAHFSASLCRQLPAQGGAIRTRLSNEFNADPARNAASASLVTSPRGTAQPGTAGGAEATLAVESAAGVVRTGCSKSALIANYYGLKRTGCPNHLMSDNVALSVLLHLYKRGQRPRPKSPFFAGN